MVYIIYDTQSMMGGEHAGGISAEEYVFVCSSPPPPVPLLLASTRTESSLAGSLWR